MNAPRIASLVAALAVATWSCSGYIADTSVAPGDTVRVTAPSLDMDDSIGTVAALETDTLTVQVEERADALYVPLADVTKLEVRRGQKSRTGGGALIGAGVGAAAGVITALAACGDSNCEWDGDTTDVTGYVAVVFGAGGALLGAGIGALIGSASKTDRWETVPLEEIRVGPSSVDADGVEVSVTLRL
jgi:hypothetical protein